VHEPVPLRQFLAPVHLAQRARITAQNVRIARSPGASRRNTQIEQRGGSLGPVQNDAISPFCRVPWLFLKTGIFRTTVRDRIRDSPRAPETLARPHARPKGPRRGQAPRRPWPSHTPQRPRPASMKKPACGRRLANNRRVRSPRSPRNFGAPTNSPAQRPQAPVLSGQRQRKSAKIRSCRG